MIFNTNPEYNPDYPSSNGMGFEQYCYQQAAPSMEYYYAGGNSVFQAPGSPDPFSRRNQPTMPQAVPNAPFVQPGVPQVPTAGWGFNQLAESRRNLGPAPQAAQPTAGFGMQAPTPGYNPWGSLPTAIDWSQQPGYAPMVPQFDQSCINAAQQHHGLFYEQPQYPMNPQPVITWGSQNTINLDQAKYQPVQFPFQAQQQMQTSWLEQAKQNFAMK